MNEYERERARFLLTGILLETKNILKYLLHKKPKIFQAHLKKTVLDEQRVLDVLLRLDHSVGLIREDELDWDAVEKVGLSGATLEWKASILFLTIGKPVPQEEARGPRGGRVTKQQQSPDILTYPEGKPVWRRLFKLLLSIFGSLIKAVKEGSELRFILDFIKEYLDHLEASTSYLAEAKA